MEPADRPAVAELAGGRFAALTDGPAGGPVVVCLHGFPDHPESFAPLAARLAGAGYRVVAPWMRGYAPSTRSGPFDLETLADDALAIAREVAGGRRFALLGHDWGALAVWAAWARAPADLACAVTMAVPHPAAAARHLARSGSQLRRSWYTFFFQLPRLPERALAWRDFALVDALWRAWSPGFELAGPARRRLKQCLAASLPAPIEYYRALPRQLGGLRRRRPAVAIPVLHLHGARDGCIEAAAAAGQERLVDGPFACAIVDGAGHFLQLERPDEVARRVLDWLAAHGPPA